MKITSQLAKKYFDLSQQAAEIERQRKILRNKILKQKPGVFEFKNFVMEILEREYERLIGLNEAADRLGMNKLRKLKLVTCVDYKEVRVRKK